MARLGLVEDHPFLIKLLLLDLHQVAAPVESELNDILQQLSVLNILTSLDKRQSKSDIFDI